jgi:hypothetical protein
MSQNMNKQEIVSNITNHIVNDTYIHKYENVISYKYDLCNPKLIIIHEDRDITSNEPKYYFVFDCPGEDALGHWVYESFIFHSLYSELKRQYPTLQILSSNKKKYVKILLRFFGLDDVVTYEIDSDKNNVCFFAPIISLNHLTDAIVFKKYINIYVDSIKSKLIDFPKKNKIVFLPRNTVDNYAVNDRTVPVNDEIRKNIIENDGSVINTYELNNITFQYNIVNNSDIIIIDYGSSFNFNCIFLENKKIILLCDGDIDFYLSFPANKILFDYISNKNNIVFVNFRVPNFSFEHNIKIHL